MSQIAATSVSEVGKMKIWTPDNDLGALTAFDAFGISPIPLPYGDVLMGLQTGLINGIAAPPVGTCYCNGTHRCPMRWICRCMCMALL